VILFFWFGIGGFFIVVVPLLWALAASGPNLQIDPATGTPLGLDRFVGYIALNLSFLTFLIGILVAVSRVHGRSPRTLITPYRRIDWRRVGQGFGIWVALAAVAALIEALLFPGRYVLTFDPARFALIAPVVLLLTPMQTTTEELFFRGYLLQAFGLRTRRPWLLALITATLFTLPHLFNPEVFAGSGALVIASYFGIGAVWALATLADDGLELALGAHAGNNLFSALVANYDVSALETDSIFTIGELDAVYADLSLLIMAVIFWLLVFRVLRRSVVA
jgi:membrane protease YdiL (CAAX protease family)